jgi:hypothetical protein
MWLSWRIATAAALILAAAAALAWRRGGRWRAAAAFARETALVLTLFSIWQVAAQLALTRIAGAVGHGVALWDVERTLRLPSELAVQRAALGHPLLVQAANDYYAVVHVPALIVFLVWLFCRHRSRYAPVRTMLALLTAACLLIQMVPVAPPRLVTGLGVTDTGLLYHQSVYGPVGAGVADQLSAMPSVHVAWAGLIALAVVRVSSSPWRWLVVAHPVLTLLVVVVTGNHYWLDGLAALGLLAVAAAVLSAGALIGTMAMSRELAGGVGGSGGQGSSVRGRRDGRGRGLPWGGLAGTAGEPSRSKRFTAGHIGINRDLATSRSRARPGNACSSGQEDGFPGDKDTTSARIAAAGAAGD